MINCKMVESIVKRSEIFECYFNQATAESIKRVFEVRYQSCEGIFVNTWK